MGLGDMAAIAALCAAAEKSSSPGRALRSRGGVLGDNADGTKAKPPQLPGRKKSTKALLHEQPEILLTQPLAPQEQPSPPTKPPSLPPLPPPPPPLPPRRSTICNWAQAVICDFPQLAPLPCQVDGCDLLVHHLCQHAWEDKRGHEEYVPRVCCIHHPNYKYAHEPEKPVTPPRPTINPTHSKEPPRNLFSNPSPADSTITGGPGDSAAAKKRPAPSIAAGKRGPKKRKKDPPNSDVTTIAASNQGRVTLLGFDEGDADGSVHCDDSDDVLGDLGDSDDVDPLIPGHRQTVPRSVSRTRQHQQNVAREPTWLS